ncbi:lactate dehydrogenase [Clostridium sp. D2Q-14]|uniref:lactate/malate family dehydrogenase n=1 Tax=Anaeromonas gelatinilytica TaxID=2683194 RepID=UPI00193BC550|nr:lactate dehydrogenase [Anaeromonas gelatinilytica]MBS4534610.1 lactate dehydrogenase [Anaeromonas gelatinilytica]
MNLYQIDKNIYGFSYQEYNFKKAKKENLINSDKIYYLFKNDPLKSRRSYIVSSPSLLSLKKEDINILNNNKDNIDIYEWIEEKINSKKIIAINLNYPNWKDILYQKSRKSWNINVLALGNVGTTLLTGLKLLGGNKISRIGIYDRTLEKQKRWEMEMNQVYSAFNYNTPEVEIISRDKIFDCDMFVFCASKSVPKVGSNIKDVRMAQFESNSDIIKEYAIQARKENFKGIFAVVSDPVDLLSKVAFLESNKNKNGDYDFNGLSPEQIRGYGLGVMNARAVYYAKKNPELNHFLTEGRAYGPHGEGLIIADSIKNYNENLSMKLTAKAKNANLEMRKLGYKPYIAPALSSGALSIIDTIDEKWHYSSTFIGGVFMGCKNRLINNSIEIESIEMNNKLFERIKKSYENLGEII